MGDNEKPPASRRDSPFSELRNTPVQKKEEVFERPESHIDESLSDFEARLAAEAYKPGAAPAVDKKSPFEKIPKKIKLPKGNRKSKILLIVIALIIIACAGAVLLRGNRPP